ncbi:MAG: TonB-dependent receptor [Bacteroidales bacterium]|nr:TonB-dependent receptor [Bacteroidales bacterium]
MFLGFVLLTLVTTFRTHDAFAMLPAIGRISGMVNDSLSGEGLAFASVQVMTYPDSVIITGVMADGDGLYMVTGLHSGTYILMASYMGYETGSAKVETSAEKTQHDFLLTKKNIVLSEVAVTADKSLMENNIKKTTVNVSKNMTVSGGTASDVMQTLPSVDFDIDGNLNYRGSDKVVVLINGQKSELVKSLDQIPAGQIEKIELINNPSAKYDAEGMSGIINIVLKSGKTGNSKTTLTANAGYPETFGANAGYSGMSGNTRYFFNAGIKHQTKFQTKEHLRKNYEDPDAFDYYQYDRQDQNLNDVFLNTNVEQALNSRHKLGFTLVGSKKFNTADRNICYKTLNHAGAVENETLKNIGIDLANDVFDGNVNYSFNISSGKYIMSNLHFSLLDQIQEMKNTWYPNQSGGEPALQNTFSEQSNRETGFSMDYLHPEGDSLLFETGYHFDMKDLINDFSSVSLYPGHIEWVDDTTLDNRFNFVQYIHALYFNLTTKFSKYELMVGLRGELTSDRMDRKDSQSYADFFPSVTLSRKIGKMTTVFAGYNRRINRPTIKMLNPFSDEYADILNMHHGNPDLKPEYVNSVEAGSRFTSENFTVLASGYFRHIDQAISRVKSATNDSALMVTFMNLNQARVFGGEAALAIKPFRWWNINISSNIFYTNLMGTYGNNEVDNSKTGWNLTVANNHKLTNNFDLQWSAYYRSKLPSVMGTYKERYYMDMALGMKLMANKARLVLRISDVFNTYCFGLDLDALDENNYHYSQRNRRKNESQYFILSFMYNFNGKDQSQKKQKENFFLDDFDK